MLSLIQQISLAWFNTLPETTCPFPGLLSLVTSDPERYRTLAGAVAAVLAVNLVRAQDTSRLWHTQPELPAERQSTQVLGLYAAMAWREIPAEDAGKKVQ